MHTEQRREVAQSIATDQGGVVSRRQLRDSGILAADVRAEVRAGRWRTHGLQTVAVHTRDLTVEQLRRRAIWETGERVTQLDGVTALQAAGLDGFDEATIHVSVLHTHNVKRMDGVHLHKIARRLPDERVASGIPRTRPATAAVRAAHWARSDRQAALIMVMTVQQGLCRPGHLLEARLAVRGRSRRAFIRGVIDDLALGVRALGELDFARLCRARGLPEPVRQQLREGRGGRVYLDVRWSCGLVVEIDGAHHFRGLAPVDDLLRQNRVALEREMVLRIPNLGLRLHEDEFMEQVAMGLRRRGGLSA